MTFTPCSERRDYRKLEIVRAAYTRDDGFLMGEALASRACHVIGGSRELVYRPLIRVDGRYYEGDRAMTVAEFAALPSEKLLGRS